MAYDQNKSDFENALENLEKELDSLEAEIPENLYSAITSVVEEYNGHLKDDIEQLSTDLESANDKLDELNSILGN
jgi:chromosome segregation ATPase